HSGERPLRVPPCELAIVDFCFEVDLIAAVFRNVQPVMDRIRSPWWNQSHISHRPRHPRIAFVDLVPVFVELKAAIEMCARLYRASAAVCNFTAVKDLLTFVV